MISPVEWEGDSLKILDQTKLPDEIIYLNTDDYHLVIEAISSLRVRGAPAIGVAAAYGIALAAQKLDSNDTAEFINKLDSVLEEFASSRPTAVNLFKSVSRMKNTISPDSSVENLREALWHEAQKIHQEERFATQQISKFGAILIEDGFTVLTHCNTGPLATAGYGTALGIIIEAWRQGKKIDVLATETRPLFQGARLTVWELQQAGVPVRLIIDSAAGYYIKSGKVKCVLIGADRIAASGDTANKIGSYSLAVIAHENNVPFYVAAPSSTVDLSIESGDDIIIEERSPAEITNIGGLQITPQQVTALNPAFDITPAEYITSIITEKGLIKQPFDKNLKKVLRSSKDAVS
jgi:methylthioribose-1-phosphate isomerase